MNLNQLHSDLANNIIDFGYEGNEAKNISFIIIEYFLGASKTEIIAGKDAFIDNKISSHLSGTKKLNPRE